ncbi:MAG: metallophosphoesterase [Desulfurivibrionaceae bacterium]
MFGLILISIVTIFHLYVFWRVGSVSFIKDRIPLKTLAAGGIILWSLFFLGRVYGHTGGGPIAAGLEFIGMTWMATLFLLFTTFLVADLFTGFGFFLRSRVPRIRGAALVAGLILALFGMIQGMRPPLVTDHQVALPGLPSELAGLKMVVVSDLHLGSQLGGKWLSGIVGRVLKEKPDLILLVGDIYEGHERPSGEILSAMRKLNAPLGVWAVLGNHEFYGGPEVIDALIDDSGLTVLRNSHVEIRPGLVLAGVESGGRHRLPENGAETLGQALPLNSPEPVILLSHKPWQVEEAAALGADLMISGHTHNGQIWPFGYLVKRMFPYLAGRYRVNGMTLLVGRGTGTWGPRMRLWLPGEILKVILVRE